MKNLSKTITLFYWAFPNCIDVAPSALIQSDSASISAPLNFPILGLSLLITQSLCVYHHAGLSRSWWELVLWSRLMPTAHIRTRDLVTQILSRISKCKSGSRDHNDFWINKIHLLLDHCTSHIPYWVYSTYSWTH